MDLLATLGRAIGCAVFGHRLRRAVRVVGWLDVCERCGRIEYETGTL